MAQKLRGNIIRKGFVGLAAFLLAVGGLFPITSTAVAADNPYDWKLTTAGVKNWLMPAVSADGSRIVTGVSTSYLYTSDDGGETWTELTELGTDNWASVALSGDGSTIVAVGSLYGIGTDDGGETFFEAGTPTHIAISHDFGETWTRAESAGLHYWQGAAVSYDGSTILATRNGYEGGVSISHNGGTSWIDSLTIYDTFWNTAAMSLDKQTIIIGGGVGYIRLSTDGGETWSEVNLAGGNNLWFGSAVSDDGSKIALLTPFGVGLTPGGVYVSENNGASWEQLSTPEALALGAISMSADGNSLALTTNISLTFETGYVYTSDDFGATWEEHTSLGQRSWGGIDMNADGSLVVVSANSDTIFGNDGGPMYVGTREAPSDDDDDDEEEPGEDDGGNNGGGGSGETPKPPKQTPHTPASPIAQVPVTKPTDTSVKLVLSVDNKKLTGGTTISSLPTFMGSGAPPHSLVVITVHSDPVECRTTANARGDWSCTLERELEPGDHTVRIAVTDTDNTTTHFGPFAVVVPDAVPDPAPAPQNPETPAAEPLNIWPYLLGGLGLLASIVLIIVFSRRARSV